jgi:hypothetical protein
MPAIVGFVKWCKWTQVSLLFLRSSTFQSTVTELSQLFSTDSEKLEIKLSIGIDEDIDDMSLTAGLMKIQDVRTSKVVVAMALEATYLKIALRARAEGMVSGWAYLGLDTVPLAANYASAKGRVDANLAFNGWVYFEPEFLAGPEFFDRVRNATRSDFPALFDEGVLPSRYAATMYDAITLFATVANQQNLFQGGAAFFKQSVGNTSFVGETGSVKLDAHGDLLLSYQALNIVFKNGVMQRIAVGSFNLETRTYTRSPEAIIWPGYESKFPIGSDPEDFSTAWVLGGSAIVSIVLIVGAVYYVRWRYRELRHILMMVSSELTRLLLHLSLTAANVGTDVLSCVSVVSNKKLRPEYRLAYLVFICLGFISGLTALICHMHNLWMSRKHILKMVVEMKEEAKQLNVLKDARRKQLDQYKWQISEGSREILSELLVLLSAFCQGASRPQCRNRRAPLFRALTFLSAPW